MSKGAKYLIFPVAALALTLSACDSSDKKAVQEEQDDGHGVVEEVSPESSRIKDGLLPFSIAFKLDGTPVILDENGRLDEWKKIELPVKTGTVYEIGTVTYAVVQGSCKVMVQVAQGVWAEKTYPSALCKKWGIPES